jgi:hypothetical protein
VFLSALIGSGLVTVIGSNVLREIDSRPE